MSIFNNKKIVAYTISSVLLLSLFIPILSQAALVPCGNPDQPACNFDYAISMINGIIKWIISIAGVIFAISAIYGGFLYVTSGVNPGNKEKAKNILLSTLTGFVIILVSWLIVYTILRVLAPQNESIFLFIGNGK